MRAGGSIIRVNRGEKESSASIMSAGAVYNRITAQSAVPENQNKNGAAPRALVPAVEISKQRIVLWN